MKVCKFGGTSLADANQFRKVKDIILSDPSRKIIVVSAPGKRDKQDIKITDMLYSVYGNISSNESYIDNWNQIKNRYNQIIEELELDLSLENEYKAIEKKLDAKTITKDECASLGEFLSAKVMASFLNFEFIDARRIMKFNNDNKLNEYASIVAMNSLNITNKGVVIPGFYGEKEDGSIAVFSRGGSDVTGSYVAKGFKAEAYENFTDVSGILMSDPKIIKDAKKITKICYEELRELSYLGASVFHEDALFPLFDYPIPLVIKNTNAPDDSGTSILKEVNDNHYLITGVTGKKEFVSLTFVKKKSAEKIKVMLDVLNTLNKYKIAIEHIPSSIDSFSIIIDKKKFLNNYDRIMEDLNKIENVISIHEDQDIALVAIVGKNMKEQAGISGKILSCLGKSNINIKLIAQSCEEISIILGISNDDFTKAIETLYNNFAFVRID